MSRTPRLAAAALLLAMASTQALVQAEPTAATTSAAAKPKRPDSTVAEAVRQGDEAYLQKAYAEAEAAYERAVEAQPHNPVGFARLAAAKRELGKFDEALAALKRGLEASTTVTERAKLLFLAADVHERQHALEQAAERWTEYLETAGGVGERTIDLDAPESQLRPVAQGEKAYPAAAEERLKQVNAATERYKMYAPVRQRVERREREADEKSRRR